jgi:S1-C subfamily serine protease
MPLNRTRLFLLVGTILAAGFLAGLVVSGRLDITAPSTAAPQAPAPPAVGASGAAAAVAATGTLPDLSAIAAKALQVSVNISSTNMVRMNVDPFFQRFFGDQVQPQQSLGSGVVVSPDGYILTNTHVIGEQSRSVRVTLPDGKELPAELIGIDAVSDLAVVKVEGANLPTIPWGDSGQLRVAEWVLAIGNPFQLSGTVTLGIVSTVVRSAEQVGSYQDFIQTDAAINPGNSGGALVNARGELVGINTMIYSETGGYQGIGFAIPSNAAREIMTELIQNGRVSWGSIGRLALVDIDRTTALRNGLPSGGTLVRNLWADAPAYRSGLEPADVIRRVNGENVTSADHFTRLIIRQKVGSTVTLDVVKRDGREVQLKVPVVARQTQGRR